MSTKIIYKYFNMVENILVLKNYDILVSKHGISNSNDLIHPCHKPEYNAMEKLLVESARKFIPNLDRIIIDRKTVSTTQEMFKDHMIECYNHWSLKPRNILYCDLDIIFFRQFDIFSMDIQDFCLPSDVCCGFRYYPHTMQSSIWDYMFEEIDKWDTETSHWSHEMDIFLNMRNHFTIKSNVLFPVKTVLVSEIEYNDLVSTIDSDHLSAVHLGSTNNPVKCLRYMQNIALREFC